MNIDRRKAPLDKMQTVQISNEKCPALTDFININNKQCFVIDNGYTS